MRAKFCSDCGEKLDENRAKDHDKFHVDVAHPILPACRDMIQSVVLEAYRRELAAHPAGVPPASAEGLEDYHEEEDYGDYAEEGWGQEGKGQQEVEDLDSLATGLNEPQEGESSAGIAKEQSKDYGADLPDRPDRKAGKRPGKREQQGRFGEGIL